MQVRQPLRHHLLQPEKVPKVSIRAVSFGWHGPQPRPFGRSEENQVQEDVGEEGCKTPRPRSKRLKVSTKHILRRQILNSIFKHRVAAQNLVTADMYFQKKFNHDGNN